MRGFFDPKPLQRVFDWVPYISSQPHTSEFFIDLLSIQKISTKHKFLAKTCKYMKKEILTSIWIAKHLNTGQNIQQSNIRWFKV